jgi:hypothetical protein
VISPSTVWSVDESLNLPPVLRSSNYGGPVDLRGERGEGDATRAQNGTGMSTEFLSVQGVSVRGPAPMITSHIAIRPGLTALYGLNGAGKTKVLQAVADAWKGIPSGGLPPKSLDDAVQGTSTLLHVRLDVDSPPRGYEYMVARAGAADIDASKTAVRVMVEEACDNVGIMRSERDELIESGRFCLIPASPGKWSFWLAASPQGESAWPEWTGVPAVYIQEVNSMRGFVARRPLPPLLPEPQEGYVLSIVTSREVRAAVRDEWVLGPSDSEAFKDPWDVLTTRDSAVDRELSLEDLAIEDRHSPDALPWDPRVDRDAVLHPEIERELQGVIEIANELLATILEASAPCPLYCELAPRGEWGTNQRDPSLLKWFGTDVPTELRVPFDDLSGAQRRWATYSVVSALAARVRRGHEAGLDAQPVPMGQSDAVALVDEPESSLHQTGVVGLAKSLRDLASRVIVATHSPDIIDSADQHYHVLRTKDGGVLVREFELHPLHVRPAHRLNQLGWRQSLPLAYRRNLLFVEGPHDAVVLQGWFGERLSGTRTLMVTLDGTYNWDELEPVVEVDGNDRSRISVLFDCSDAHVVILTDRLRGSPVPFEYVRNNVFTALTRSEKAAMAELHKAREGREAYAEVPKSIRKGKTWQGCVTLLERVVASKRLDRLTFFTLSQDDIAYYMPREWFALEDFESWQDAREFYKRENPHGDGMDFKAWVNRRWQERQRPGPCTDNRGPYRVPGLRQLAREPGSLLPEFEGEWERFLSILDRPGGAPAEG